MNISRNNAALGLLLAAAIGAGAMWTYHFIHSTAASDPMPSATSDRKILYWHDPMVPGQRFDKPGKSPFMDMQLVPVYADEAQTDSGIAVSGNVSQSLGIRLGKVERTTMRSSLNAVGSIAFDEERTHLIQSRVGGYVSKLLVRSPMTRVHEGQALARITSPAWLAAEQEYAALHSAEAATDSELRNAARSRLQVLGVPLSVIETIDRTGQVDATTTLIAPITGVVTELGVREGATFAMDAVLFRINGLQSVWVNAQVPEAQVHLVPVGATITARATAWPGESFEGHVIALLPEVDASSRTFTVRARLPNGADKLSPGMFVSLDLAGVADDSQLVVPSEAVITTGQRSVVIAVGSDRSFEVRDVITGAQVGDKTVVLKGLEDGQSIVLSGQFLIDSEASLKSTVNRLSSVPAADVPNARETHLNPPAESAR
jgi:Cu(I)/Ag(I) efflux system membrane fusion protein